MNTRTETDINRAAFLEMNGVEATLQKRNDGRVVFLFPNDLQVNELMDTYANDAVIANFVFCLRRLRGRMLELRDGFRCYGNGNGRYENFPTR